MSLTGASFDRMASGTLIVITFRTIARGAAQFSFVNQLQQQYFTKFAPDDPADAAKTYGIGHWTEPLVVNVQP